MQHDSDPIYLPENQESIFSGSDIYFKTFSPMKQKFDYNTTRKPLKLPEYGRNLQRMVDYMQTIEDRKERTRAARTIISVMAGMYPQTRDLEDFEHKLWDHLAIMTNFKLDVDAPYEMPTEEKLAEKPRRVPYTSRKIRFKHYGYLVEEIIEEIIKMEDGPAREQAIEDLANQMKRQYLMWNRRQVSDEAIFKDLEELSRGALKMNRNIVLRSDKDLVIIMPTQPKHQNRKKRRKK